MKKKYILAVLALCISISSKIMAQTPVGTIVSNFTLTDLNGTSHSLFDYLDSGKMVVINIDATWDGPGWAYHNTGALNDFYIAHGQSGSNDAMALFIEGDISTTIHDLYGTGSNTQGDWFIGENTPIIDLTASSESDFLNSGLEISYFPVMYVICPNRTVLQSGPANQIGTLSALNSYIGVCPSPASQPIDVAALSYEGNLIHCDGDYVPVVQIQNNGTSALTSATIIVTQGGMTVSTGIYSGSLETYGVATVNCAPIQNFNGGSLQVSVTTIGDTSVLNNNLNPIIETTAVSASLDITINITTDPYGSETTWKLFNSSGAMVSQGGPFNDLSFVGETVQDPVIVTLNPSECYRFEIYDASGDGMCCSYGNGSFSIKDSANNILLSGGQFNMSDIGYFKTGCIYQYNLFDTICPGEIFNWNGQTYDSPGLFQQIFTDQYGCDSIVTLNLTVLPNNFNPTFSSANQLYTAPPFAVQFSNSTANASNYSFTWDFGDGTTLASNNATVFHQYLFNGQYTVSLIATSNATGCTDTTTFSDYIFCTGGVSCTHTAAINQASPQQACQGTPLWLTCNNDPSFTYQWRRNGVIISGNNNDSLQVTQSGTYSVIISVNNCPVTSNDVVVNILSAPTTPVISSNGVIQPCVGGSVTLSTGNYTSYSWSTGATSQSINVSSSGTYSVNVTGANGCSAASVPYNVNASFVASPQVCIVGMDSLTNENRVVWEKPLTLGIDSFYVYKESNVSNVYTKIGATNYNDLAVFLDVNSNPAVQAYRYKISALDTCGVESNVGDFHKTIHLTINQGVGNSWNLIWSHYEGLTFGSYNIYRGTSLSNMALLTTIQSNLNSYTDLTPPSGAVYYQIEIVNPVNCDPTKSINYGVSRSNIVNNGQGGINEETISTIQVYPNPTNDKLTLDVSNDLLGKLYFVTDFAGRIIQQGKINSLKQMIDLQIISNGSYFLQVELSTAKAIKIVKQ